ncbi:MAG TPA: hypothetical protein VFA37_06935 [Gaiellaceae bacterium]|nr:hypothetical protein [Gaiellaceae bacterium]
MRNRRFLLLSAVLVALNTALWLTPEGLALRQAALPQLFGRNLIRADVVDTNGEWRIDRGVITAVTPTQLTLKEADGRIQPIAISSSTTSVVFGAKSLALSALGPRWHVLVTWPANGTADMVKVERRPARLGIGGGRGRSRK